MTDAWETINGLNPNSAADASQDTDADGYSNLKEFQLGMNPRLRTKTYSDFNADGRDDFLVYEPQGGYVSVALSKDANSDGRGDHFEASPSYWLHPYADECYGGTCVPGKFTSLTCDVNGDNADDFLVYDSQNGYVSVALSWGLLCSHSFL